METIAEIIGFIVISGYLANISVITGRSLNNLVDIKEELQKIRAELTKNETNEEFQGRLGKILDEINK